MAIRAEQHSASLHHQRGIGHQRMPAHIQRQLHKDIASAPTVLRLKSRNPFWHFYRNINNLDDFKSRWKQWWENITVTNKHIIADPTDEIMGQELPRHTWVRLNRIRHGFGCCAYLLHKWNYADNPNCECGSVQTMEHIWRVCNAIEGDLMDIHNATDTAINWITNLRVDI